MLRFEWDQAKNETNKAKHGIDFETAQLVFDDPDCITFVERLNYGEQRWHAIGSIENIIILVVVHTYREENSDEVIRIISARPATRHERKLYAQAIGEEA
ncbi:MAG: BrnT family toxin [Terriglobia bacterium]